MDTDGDDEATSAESARPPSSAIDAADRASVIALCVEAEAAADPATLAALTVELGRLRRQAETAGDPQTAGFLDACTMRIGLVRDQAFIDAAERAAQAERDRVDRTVLAFLQANQGAGLAETADRTGLELPEVAVSVARLKASGALLT